MKEHTMELTEDMPAVKDCLVHSQERVEKLQDKSSIKTRVVEIMQQFVTMASLP